jgi:hypothetical protein
MIDEAIHRLLKNSDDYIKIFIIIWIKTREIYLDYNKNNKISLHKRIESLSNFCSIIRKRCEKSGKLINLSKILKYIEIECKNNKDKIDKLYNITTLLKMFDLPKPISELIDTLGLANPEENDFANVINELFDDDINIKQIVEDSKNGEGTLIELVNGKCDKDKLNKLQDIPLRNEVQSKNLVVINKKISDNSIVENNESKQITKKENTNTDRSLQQKNIPNNQQNIPQQNKRDSIHQYFSNKNIKNEIISSNNIKNGQKKISIDLSAFGLT